MTVFVERIFYLMRLLISWGTRLRLFAALLFAIGCQQATAGADDLVYIDNMGRIRWSETHEEARFFGVNYNAPFAYTYRALERIGVDYKTAIDMDVTQLRRLGLNAYRVHIWDRQISDHEGNLIENAHLDALDYLISRLAAEKIRVVITPIAWWPSGWPEPAPVEPGFSQLYSRAQLANDRRTWEIQRNYVAQVLNHKNQFSSVLYKDDPNIIAIELVNEPKHDGKHRLVERYINEFVASLRAQDVTKPIFYNISEQDIDREFARAVCGSMINGVSYQWYPTGLMRLHQINSNMLPAVQEYPLPYDDISECSDKAKIVYEFDAADVGGSYMYPKMAKAFRSAGFQWATQFAYDPSHIASTNAEYNTHYLNLLYTPGKAISMMIASEIFRSDTSVVDSLRVEYKSDLSEYWNRHTFLYSNTTDTLVEDVSLLRRIAGVGSSHLVDYSGTGAYFLDKLSDGAWQLTVYPDVVELKDPYQSPSDKNEVSRLCEVEREIRVSLPDLGARFQVVPLNRDAPAVDVASDGTFVVLPGVYVLTQLQAQEGKEGMAAGFHIPHSTRSTQTVVRNETASLHFHGNAIQFRATVVDGCDAPAALLYVRKKESRQYDETRLRQDRSYEYVATIPADSHLASNGVVEYFISVRRDSTWVSYPGAVEGRPTDWNFGSDNAPWFLKILPQRAPIRLIDPRTIHANSIRHKLGPDSSELSIDEDGKPVVWLNKRVGDTENDTTFLLAEVPMSTRNAIKGKERIDGLSVTLKASGFEGLLKVHLVDARGTSWSTLVDVSRSWVSFSIPLEKFRRDESTLIPAGFPSFLHASAVVEKLDDKGHARLDPKLVELVGITVSSEMLGAASASEWRGVGIKEVSMVTSG